MSNYSKSSTAIKKKQEEFPEEEPQDTLTAEIIPWPDIQRIIKKPKARRTKKVHLEGKFLYYKGKKIPILQFQKSGYDKLLKYLVKEMER